jgi:hypothetical protein
VHGHLEAAGLAESPEQGWIAPPASSESEVETYDNAGRGKAGHQSSADELLGLHARGLPGEAQDQNLLRSGQAKKPRLLFQSGKKEELGPAIAAQDLLGMGPKGEDPQRARAPPGHVETGLQETPVTEMKAVENADGQNRAPPGRVIQCSCQTRESRTSEIDQGVLGWMLRHGLGPAGQTRVRLGYPQSKA